MLTSCIFPSRTDVASSASPGCCFLRVRIRLKRPLRNAEGAAGTTEQRATRAYEAARGNPLRPPRVPRAHAQGRGPALPHERGDLRRNLYSRGCGRRPLRGPREPFLHEAMATAQSAPPQPACGEGKVPAAKAFSDQHLYDALIDAFSMRSFVPYAGVSGHDHFFDTFGKFGGIEQHRHDGELAR